MLRNNGYDVIEEGRHRDDDGQFCRRHEACQIKIEAERNVHQGGTTKTINDQALVNALQACAIERCTQHNQTNTHARPENRMHFWHFDFGQVLIETGRDSPEQAKQHEIEEMIG